MGNFTDGSVNTHPTPKFEGFEQRLLDELKILVAERAIEVIDPVVAVKPGRPPFRKPAWRRVGLVGAVGLAASSVAAAVVLAGGLVSSGPAPGSGGHVELTSFLSRAEAAARSHPVVTAKPGQIFFERVKDGVIGPKTGTALTCYLSFYDTPATGLGEFPTKTVACHRVKGEFTSPFIPDPTVHGYPNPAKLPTQPAKLLAVLRRDAIRGKWDGGVAALSAGNLLGPAGKRDEEAFTLIGRMLEVPLRPALRAALFEVTGKLPGITIDRKATDIAGRPGVGLSLPLPTKGAPHGLALELVLNSKTYKFLGLALTDSIDGTPAHPSESGYAVIKSGLVTPKKTAH